MNWKQTAKKMKENIGSAFDNMPPFDASYLPFLPSDSPDYLNNLKKNLEQKQDNTNAGYCTAVTNNTVTAAKKYSTEKKGYFRKYG